ncbi:hypothetical protein RAO22_06650 [Pediococcus acidilactici]
MADITTQVLAAGALIRQLVSSDTNGNQTDQSNTNATTGADTVEATTEDAAESAE